MGQLFEELERRGALKNTLVIITSDHGEEFGEHKLYLHGQSVYREEVRVPLIFLDARRIPNGRSVREPVSLREIPATITGQLGLAATAPFPGRSLSRWWDAHSEVPTASDTPIFSEAAVTGTITRTDPARPPSLLGPLASIVLDGKVYIRDALNREQLFNLSDDPAELHNLAGEPAEREALERCRVALGHITPARK